MKTEFIHQAQKYIYTQVTKDLNMLVGASKTSAASLGLFLNLPIQIEARKLPTKLKPKKPKHIAQSISAYLKHDDSTAIVFVFYYSEDKQLSKLTKLLTNPKVSTYFTYLYAREMMRVVLRHNTKAHYNMMRKQLTGTSVSPDKYLFLINAVSYYKVNYQLHKLFKISPMASDIDSIFKYQLHSPALAELPDNELLAELVKQLPYQDEDYDDGVLCMFDQPYTDYLLSDEYDEHIVDIGESITTTIKSYGRGTASAEIFGELFGAVKTNVGWFRKFKQHFNRIVYHSTSDVSNSWSSLNNTYRHVFKSPKKLYQDTTLEVILSIDSSGSMSTTELGKILYVIQKKAKYISKLHVLIHDTEVIKQFTLESASRITDDPQFEQALATRYGTGGTEHYSTFLRVLELVKDPNKIVYISASDNCSDIPQSIKALPKMKLIETIWLDTSGCNPLPPECGGTNIALS